MQIEWKVGAVERDVLRNESRYPPMRAPRKRLQPTPEQAVVHEQQIRPLLRRDAHGGSHRSTAAATRLTVPRLPPEGR